MEGDGAHRTGGTDVARAWVEEEGWLRVTKDNTVTIKWYKCHFTRSRLPSSIVLFDLNNSTALVLVLKVLFGVSPPRPVTLGNLGSAVPPSTLGHLCVIHTVYIYLGGVVMRALLRIPFGGIIR